MIGRKGTGVFLGGNQGVIYRRRGEALFDGYQYRGVGRAGGGMGSL